MEENLTIIEIRLKVLRERSGFTQNELAKKLNVSRSLISIWENGLANISLKQLIKLASIYKVPIDYILGIIDDINTKEKFKYIQEINLKYIGEKLREIRKKEKLTQEHFAKIIDTKRSSISYYEIGKMMISTADLKQICETFGHSADYIVGNTNNCLKRNKKEKLSTKKIKSYITN